VIRDAETGWAEATIQIEGVTLTFAESMTVRVALSAFRMRLADPAFRDGLGEQLARNYDEHARMVERMLLVAIRHDRRGFA
jgi:hypothetical protein